MRKTVVLAFLTLAGCQPAMSLDEARRVTATFSDTRWWHRATGLRRHRLHCSINLGARTSRLWSALASWPMRRRHVFVCARH